MTPYFKPAFLAPALVSVFALGLTACDDDDDNINPVDDEGSLTVFIADAPVDFAESVTLRFAEVVATKSDGTEFRVEVPAENDTVNLLDTATGSAHMLLDSVDLDEGDYTSIALLVDTSDASVNFVASDADGDGTAEQYPLQVSGGTISSDAGFSISEVGGDSLLLDVDLRRSLSGSAENGTFVLTPALRQSNNPDELGSISGAVNTEGASELFCEDEDARVAVYVYEGSIQVPGDVSGSDDEAEPFASGIVISGEYVVPYLPAGDYSAAYTCQAGSDQPDSNDAVVFSDVQTVSVPADGNGSVNF